MAPPPRHTVPIPRSVLAALVVGLVGLLVVVAFLIGRESTHRTPQPSASASLQPAAAPSAATVEGSHATASTLAAVPLGASDLGLAAPPTAAPTTGPASASSAVPPQDPTGAAVRHYFEEIEALQAQGKYWNDAESFGRTLIDQASRGDASGFDELIAANQRVRDSVAAMTVPAPCEEHHSRTVRLLDEGLSLLKDVKSRFHSEEATGLEAIAANAYAIQNRAKEVDALATDVKRRYGIVQ